MTEGLRARSNGGRWLGFGWAGLLAWLLSAGWLAAATPSLVATVNRIQGKARISTDGDHWQEIKAGVTVQPGTFVQTSRHGAVVDLDLVLPSAGSASAPQAATNLVRLFADSIVEIQTLSASTANPDSPERMGLNLRSGRMLAVVRRLPAGAEYHVRFPGGLAGVAGASTKDAAIVFVIEASGAVTVLSGRLVVALEGPEIRTQVVAANERCEVRTGKVAALAPNAPERKLWAEGSQAESGRSK